MARQRYWHVSGWNAVLFAPITFPFAVLLALARGLNGSPGTVDLTASEVESYLDDFINDRGAPFDWDDFCSVPISDPALNGIRHEAEMIPLPVDDEGHERLRKLLARVRDMYPADP